MKVGFAQKMMSWANTADQRIESKIYRENPNLKPRPPSKDRGFPTDFIDFRRMIGNPFSKTLNISQDMAPFQVDYHEAIQEHHWVIPLKSRKIGATDTAITSFALNTFDRYVGHDVMIVAGNELRIAKEILLRFYEFFTDKHHEDGFYAFKQIEPEYLENGWTWQEAQKKGQKIFYDDLVKNARLSQDPVIEFNNGTRTFAFAASKQEKAQSFRGTDDVIAILVSEAAHTGMKNDQPIMNALEPNLAQRDDADFILESTGNGRRGFYFKYWMQIMELLAKQFKMRLDDHQKMVDKLHELWHKQKIAFEMDWFPLMWDYRVGIKHGIISEKFINREKRNQEIDFAQEYEGKFTSTYTSAIPSDVLSFKDTADPKYTKSINLNEMTEEDGSESEPNEEDDGVTIYED